MRPPDWASRQFLTARFRFQRVSEKNGRNNQIHVRLKRVCVGAEAGAGGLIENIHPCMNCVNCVVFSGESVCVRACAALLAYANV